MRNLNILLVVALACSAVAVFAAEEKAKDAKDVPAVLNFTMDTLDGKPVDLSKYKGKVVMIVNTASKCGNTPQYAKLEALHEKYADKGLSILGFPANEFKQQEPGSNEEIATFCKRNYDVSFPIMSSVRRGQKAKATKVLIENLKLSFNKIEVVYTPQGPDGQPKGSTTFADQWAAG